MYLMPSDVPFIWMCVCVCVCVCVLSSWGIGLLFQYTLPIPLVHMYKGLHTMYLFVHIIYVLLGRSVTRTDIIQ
jgi:hypothetical protein